MHSAHPLKFILRQTFRALRPALLGGMLLLTLASARAQTITTPYVFSHLAGSIGGPGSTDGIGSAARFDSPTGVAVDAAGNIYVADRDNHTIRKITPGGIVTTLAGTAGVQGSADGTGPAAQFNNPQGVAVDSAGIVYVADSGAVRRITSGGVVTTLAGTAGVMGYVDGTGPAAQFYYLNGVAVDAAGTVYVADRGNNTLRKITPSGMVTTLASWAARTHATDPTSQNYFTGIAVDGAGNVYATDPGNCTIRKISPSGVVTTLAGAADNSGSADGTGPLAQFSPPSGVAVDNAGNIYVADSWNSTIRKITPGGTVTTLVGTAGVSGSADGSGQMAQFDHPYGITVNSAGNVYVADRPNHTIRKITPDGIVTTLAGMAGAQGSADGAGTAAQFHHPSDVAVDSAGNYYVADTYNHTIRKITPGGVVTTLAGTAGIQGSADGNGPAAQFYYPYGVAVDSTGNVYVSDSGNDTIRKITPGGVVTTLAGTAGVRGYSDGIGSAAQFYVPNGVAVDGVGNVYVPDPGYGTIRKITASGVVTTLAGTAGVLGSADGTGSAAQFNGIAGVAADSAGNVYVADGSNTIRKITSGGVVTTLAGTAGVVGSTDGTGPAAQFNSPSGIAVDSANNVYVTDAMNFTIRKITPGGVVTTLAGTAGVKGSADGIGLAAQFNYPAGLAVDKVGAIYVADSENNAIRKGVPAAAPVITTQPLSQTVVAGGSMQFSVVAGGVPAPTYQWFFNGSVFNGATASTLSFTSALSTDAGDYTVVVTNALGTVTSAKATLTVSAAPVTPPAPTPAASGGGGAIDMRFALALLALVGARRFAGSRKS